MSRFEKITKSQAAMLIKNWLLEEGLSVKDFADESTDINYATKVGNIAIHLGFHKSSIDSVIVLGAIGLEPQERSMFRYTKTKREFMYDIELTFLQLNLDFIIDIPPTEQEFTIENIKLQKTIYFDGLSKDRLFDVISSIFNGLKLLSLKFTLLGKQQGTSQTHST